VLLKNAGHTLPLSKSVKKIAVIGPNADNPIAVLGNYNGTPSSVKTVYQGIKEKLPNAEVTYEKAINFTNDTLLAYEDMDAQYHVDGHQGFKAEYFDHRDLTGNPVTRYEQSLTHFWQEGEEVAGSIKARDFSARYTTSFTPAGGTQTTFEIEGDDGYRFFINGQEVLNAWTRNRWGAQQYTLKTEPGKSYQLTLEYWQGDGKANIRLSAGTYKKADLAALAGRLKDADAIIYVGGISPQLEGEEMRVNYPGFNGGDRTSIQLPGAQTELMKLLQQTGRPVIFVMMTGSALAIPWEAQHIPAIINAWYGGQAAGTAVADVIFGDYNPAGRLPVTFYNSDKDLPEFTDYSMKNRTYRYFKGTPLYGFGYGLSYTTFKYTRCSVPATVRRGKKVEVSVSVTNTGTLDGEEVVQIYLSHAGRGSTMPLKALKGFSRIFLKAGERRVVKFSLSPQDLSLVTENGKLREPKGKIVLSAGGYQPDEKNVKSGNVLTRTLTVL